MNTVHVRVRLNGEWREVDVPPYYRLLDLIRTTFGLTGTKEGCGEGECGACTVLLDGMAVDSCLMMAFQADGRDVLTIEGLAGDELHVLQQSFIDRGAVQCGYCTPGMILSAKALLDKNPRPTRQEIKVALSGNLCRCTGYQKILDAVETAANQIAAARGGEGK